MSPYTTLTKTFTVCLNLRYKWSKMFFLHFCVTFGVLVSELQDDLCRTLHRLSAWAFQTVATSLHTEIEVRCLHTCYVPIVRVLNQRQQTEHIEFT